ncbi:hypothetical protein HRW14_19570 [Streptomyces lunaelactis]|uniref:hypothetical protein n=1 Tax=Streptomyces lunaelactis TaxID=1535768 RepID=UPI001584B990|nr:hypothetical protein [Streptomyces lunaelactis]NUK52439.1 hypothetical protein [Streptomyces lunaelactis]NUK66739.1 hypothetical protein [Streptomyces lunaelactis]
MTVPVRSLHFADAREAEDLAAFLARLIHYDRAAAVRLQAWGGVLAVFGRPPSFEVLAIRTARLGDPVELDVTVSAGELLESLEGAGFTVPAAVTGPPWAGLLPPRGGWRELSGLPEVTAMRGAVAAAVAEFRTRDEQLPAERRTRAERDRIGRDIWSRTVGGTGLPLRAVHAAQSLGFLRPGVPVALLSAGSWLRLRTPFGSIAVRTNGLGGLSVTPTRPG